MTTTILISDNSPMSDVSKTKVVAVTVTYNVDHRFEIALKSYLDQVDLVVIVDNSTSSDAQALLRQIVEADGKRVKLIQNGENLGLAKAQNIGITTALDEQADWVLLMDDDSSATEQMVNKLAGALHRFSLTTETAILVPQLQEQGVKREARYVVSPYGQFRQPLFGIDDFSQKSVLQNLYIAISSGSLIKADLFREIGLIRESFNIDYLDVDFCLRAIDKGYRIVAVRDAILLHNLGAQTEHQFLGRRFWAWNHSAKRRFTIYRNRTRIWREYLFRSPGFIVYDILATLQDLFRILMFEENRTTKLKAIIRGVGTGLFGSGLSKQPPDSEYKK
ncbi:MAG: glycosyltransferase family 2 protein [Candidatus Thiodiazotropha sp. 6PLUC9]